MKNIKWLDAPRDGNYKAAINYLSLLWNEQRAVAMVERLKQTKTVEFMAKDIFRASGLSLLGNSNDRIKSNLDKIHRGFQISPILLIRDEAHGKVVIADGYHRLCAVYRLGEEVWIKCRIT